MDVNLLSDILTDIDDLEEEVLRLLMRLLPNISHYVWADVRAVLVDSRDMSPSERRSL